MNETKRTEKKDRLSEIGAAIMNFAGEHHIAGEDMSALIRHLNPLSVKKEELEGALHYLIKKKYLTIDIRKGEFLHLTLSVDGKLYLITL